LASPYFATSRAQVTGACACALRATLVATLRVYVRVVIICVLTVAVAAKTSARIESAGPAG
jgi:hypothetical protein